MSDLGMGRRWLHPRATLVGVAITLALALPMVGLGVFSSSTVATESSARAASERSRSADLAAALLRNHLESVGHQLTLFVSRPSIVTSFQSRDRAGITSQLSDLRTSNDSFQFVVAITASGEPFARVPAATLPASVADRDYFFGAREAGPGGTFVSDAAPSITLPPTAVVNMSTQVMSPDGKFAGVLVIGIAPVQVLTLLAPIETGPGREVLIVDLGGRAIASSSSSRGFLAPVALPGLDAALHGSATHAEGSVNGSGVLLTYSPIGVGGWVLAIVDDKRIANAPEDTLLGRLNAGAAVAAILAAALGLAFALLYAAFDAATARELAARALQIAAERAARDRLSEINASKSAFVATVSHEFRTPLTGIVGFSETIRDESLTPEETREFANDINTEAHRLTRLVNDVLDIGRIEAGALPLHRSRVLLPQLLARVIAHTSATGSHQITLTSPAELALFADPDRLTQVFTNLVDNAIKYAPAGSPIAVNARADAGEIEVEVRDTGPGIPPEERERIFEPYARLEGSGRAGVVGTGLGLPIVRQLVELHGGRVWVESVTGGGASFRVRLPLDLRRTPRESGA